MRDLARLLLVLATYLVVVAIAVLGGLTIALVLP